MKMNKKIIVSLPIIALMAGCSLSKVEPPLTLEQKKMIDENFKRLFTNDQIMAGCIYGAGKDFSKVIPCLKATPGPEVKK